MREDFLYYIWQYKLLNGSQLYTTEGEEVEIINPGMRNYNSGPDYTAAKIRIGKTIWAGNVEIHLKTSDWFAHNHHKNPAYSNIILHLVFEDDISNTKNNNVPSPCLEISNYLDKSIFSNFQKLINQKSWVPCQHSIKNVNEIIITNWLNRLLIERLENKSEEILHFLKYNNNNWEETFYYFLSRNFGFKKNKTPFSMLAQKTPYKVLAKHKNHLFQIEAILFGQSGLIDEHLTDVYPRSLYKEYQFLKKKYNLQSIEQKLWKHSKLRPANFPCLRISQFSKLFNKSKKLFSELMETKSITQIYKHFSVECSPYWTQHYMFDKASIGKNKILGRDSINNILINTIIPFMFTYGKERLDKDLIERSIEFLNMIPEENNHIISKWKSLGIRVENAADSQSLIELKKNYCLAKQCLNCPVGHRIINN
ncbi:MAG: DUF2851 family protein [Bacteroidota bacterium]